MQDYPELSRLSKRKWCIVLLYEVNIIYQYFSSLEATLSRAFLRSLTLLRVKSDFHPRKPPLFSDQTPALLRPSA